MQTVLEIIKALSDESRLRLLLAFGDNELCVCQLVELLGLAPSTVSKHLSILRRARLLESRKQGRWMYYRKTGKAAPAAVQAVTEWLDTFVAKDPKIRSDRGRLQRILRMTPEELCSAQCQR